MIAEGLRLRRRTDEVVDDSLHHPAGVALAWMHPCREEYALLGKSLCTPRILVFTRDRQVVATVTSESARQGRPMVEVRARGVLLNSSEVLLQVRVRVWEAMREEDLILIVLESVRKCECIERAQETVIVSLVWSGRVVDAVTDTVPADALCVLNLV